MNCPNCNTYNAENASFCSSCGTPLNSEPKRQPINLIQPMGRYCGLAIASFVLSLVGLVIAGLICGIIGIVLYCLANSSFRHDPSLRGRGLATAGLIISIVDCVFMIVYIAILL